MCLLYMIFVFLSPPEPLETPYSDTDSNNMLAAVSTPRHLPPPPHGVFGIWSDELEVESSVFLVSLGLRRKKKLVLGH